jgi:hypothetical protein
MNKKEEHIDELIHQALSKEEAEFYDQLDEQNPFDQWLSLYKGNFKWFSILITVVMLIFIGLSVYSLIQFLNVGNVEEMFKWGAALFFCLIVINMMKLYGWMQMDKYALMREIKRLELQVSMLASKIKS